MVTLLLGNIWALVHSKMVTVEFSDELSLKPPDLIRSVISHTAVQLMAALKLRLLNLQEYLNLCDHLEGH